MLALSGSFLGSIRTQSVISLDDQPDHSLGVAEISGTQSSSDPKWETTPRSLIGEPPTCRALRVRSADIS